MLIVGVPARLAADGSRELSISVTRAGYAMASGSRASRARCAIWRSPCLPSRCSCDRLLALDGIYRITGLIALGLVLLAASVLYQRHRASPPGATG
jgi:hypothetical protein